MEAVDSTQGFLYRRFEIDLATEGFSATHKIFPIDII